MVSKLVLLSLATILASAQGCSLSPTYVPPTLMDQALAAGIVFRARIIEEVGGEQPFSFNRSVRMEVLDYLKGSGPSNVEVVVNGFSSGSLCGVSPPPPNSQGIVFACPDKLTFTGPLFSLNTIGPHTGYAVASPSNLLELTELLLVQASWLGGTFVPDTSIQFGDFTHFPCSNENSLHRDLDPCGLPHGISGQCLAFFQRWTFNTETGLCEQFIFGGCGGNSNNFVSRAACQAQCGVTDKCEEPAGVAGMCVGSLRRWTYNSDTDECERFTWGGCGGSANRFNKRKDCKEECVAACGVA